MVTTEHNTFKTMQRTGHDLEDFVLEAGRKMASDYQRIRKRASEDPGTAGDQGEEDWKNLLRQWLPPAYHVVTKGRLLNAYDHASPQVDILILHPTYPLALQNSNYYLADLVVAAFECKTTLKAEHIRKTMENSVKISRLWPQPSGEPYRELYRPMIYGLLAHSHSWKNTDDKVRKLIGNRIKEADEQFCRHPRGMLDLITIADFATWESHKLPWNKKATKLSPTYSLPTECPLTQYGCDFPGMPGTVMQNSAIARMLIRVLGQLSWQDQKLSLLIQYFQQTQEGSSSWGPMRVWSERVYSDQSRTVVMSDESYHDMRFPWNDF